MLRWLGHFFQFYPSPNHLRRSIKISDFAFFQLSVVASLLVIPYCAGLLVRYKGVKVNYTRKINHFALFFVPVFLRAIFPYELHFERFLVGCLVGACVLVLYIKPIRDRVPLVETMFLSFDRPEDRPHTLWWLFTQVVASYLVLIPAVIIFTRIGLEGLIYIPLMIVAFGDGLAEPVGVRFGKHKYATYAFFSEKKYVRSFEGSACVFIASLIIVAVFYASFTQTQFVLALLLIPPLMTVVEAFSPHTWDTPTLNFAGYCALYLITRVG
jgi:dolichol kinase